MSQYIVKQDKSETTEKLLDLFLNSSNQQKFESFMKLCKYHIDTIDLNKYLIKFIDYYDLEINKYLNDKLEQQQQIICLFSSIENVIKILIKNQSTIIKNLLVTVLKSLVKIFQLLNNDFLMHNTVNDNQQSQLFLTQTQINNNKYSSLIKILPEFLTNFTQLIECLTIELTHHDGLVVNICDSLLGIIKLCKDAKTSVLLWKSLSKFLLKHSDFLLQNQNFSIFDYLKQLYDTIELNLEFLKLNSIFKYDLNDDDDGDGQIQLTNSNTQRLIATNDTELVKLVRLCSFFYKIFKSLILKFVQHSQAQNCVQICLNLLVEFVYLIHYCPKFFLTLNKCELDGKLQIKNEIHTQFTQINAALMINLDFTGVIDNETDCKTYLNSTKQFLFLINYLKYTDNFVYLYKLFSLCEDLKINSDLPIYILNNYDSQLAICEWSVYLTENLMKFSCKSYSNKLINIYLYFLLYGTVKQTLVAFEQLVYLSKIKNNPMNLHKYFKIVYEATSNKHLEFLLSTHNEVVNLPKQIELLNNFLNTTSSRDMNMMKNLNKNFRLLLKVKKLQSIQNKQLKNDYFGKLIKILKIFTINKYLKFEKDGQKTIIIEFICLIYQLIGLFISDNQNADIKTICFLINFIQQFMIIEPNVNLKYTTGIFLKYIKISNVLDSDVLAIDGEVKNLNEHLITLFTYLLNSNDLLLLNFTLECLNEFLSLNLKYSDFLCTEIMRTNKRLNDFVGDYLRKTPSICVSKSDYMILSERFLHRLADSAMDDMIDDIADGCDCDGLMENLEINLNKLVEFYLSNQKPQRVRDKLENIVSRISSVI